jgi:outer membrane protein assembly factor BamA
MKTKIIITSFVILLTITNAFTQTADSLKTDQGPKKGDVFFAPLPVIMVNPTFGVMYGLAASTSTFMGDPANTRLSTSLGSITYSTKKQLMFTFKTNVYLSEDNWVLLGDWRYFDTSQPTFGLGTGPQSAKLAGEGYEYEDGMFSEPIPDAQLMEFKYVRFHETVMKKVKTNFYAGLGYHLDIHSDINDNLLNLDTTGGQKPILTSQYLYSKEYGFDLEKYTLSGVSLNFMYDSRDNAANTYKGRYALITYRYNPTFLGSSQSSSSLWLEYRDYFSLSKKPQPSHMLAFWAYGNFQTSGHMPYLDLPALGWDQFGRSGRAYTQGRFRGENIVYSELEYRAHILGTKKNPDFMGAVAFVNMTTASNNNADINLFKYVEPGYGIGLRFMVNKTSRTNITLDYAWGAYGSQGLFLSVNETF